MDIYTVGDGRDKDPKITAIKVIVIVSIVLSGAGICFCAFIGRPWSNPNIIVYSCFTLLILVNVSLLLFIKKSTKENERLRIAIIDNEKKSKEGMELFYEFRHERQTIIDQMKETELRIALNSLADNLHYFQDGEEYNRFNSVRHYYEEALRSFRNGNYDSANYYYKDALREYREAREYYYRKQINYLEEEQEALSNSIEMLMRNINDLEKKLQEARMKTEVVHRNLEQTSVDIDKNSQLQNMYDKLEKEVESLKIAVEMKASFVKFIDEAPESYDLNGYIDVFGEKYPLTLTHEQIDEAFGSTMLGLVENVN